MKKYISTFTLVLLVVGCFAQNNPSNSILVRHDTTLLKATECEWIIKSLPKNNPSFTSEIGKSVPEIILHTIQNGKLKAIDPESNKPIPAKEIFTWQMPRDTVVAFDETGNSQNKVVQALRSPDDITQIRIYQDWYFDITTSKFQSVVKWIELMEEVHTSSGIFIGYKPLCRIYY